MPKLWGRNSQQENVYSHTLSNSLGTEVCISNYGAIIRELRVISPVFGLINTVLSYSRLEEYLRDEHFIGAVVGRYSNRIANAQFQLNGKTHQLPANDDSHHLHGGPEGFFRRTWEIIDADSQYINLRLVSDNGDQGYPGTLTIDASYHLHEDNSLTFSWTAHSTEDTVVSLSNHSYFNLAGYGDIRNHYLKIPCQQFTPTNHEGIPKGEIQPVKNTSFDFTSSTQLENILTELSADLEPHGGIDHNWVADEFSDDENLLAELKCPASRLQMKVYSTLPGLQCYSGNNLAKSGVFGSYEGICLESQYYPDSPNNAHFPQATLKANTKMTHKTRFAFSQYQPN